MRILQPFLFLCLALIVLTSGCTDHSKLARADIEFMTKTILADHPGPKYSGDPAFTSRLYSIREKAIKQLKNISSREKHIALLKKYVEQFNDKHLGLIIDGLNPEKKVAGLRQLKKNYSISELMPGVAWVRLPLFAPQNKEKQKQLKNVVATLPNYRNHKYVIFDVRGNRGGNSAWGKKIVKALFGERFGKQKIAAFEDKIPAYFRVSKGNLDHVEDAITVIANEFGKNSEQYRAIIKVRNGMSEALKKGADLFLEPNETTIGTNEPTTNRCQAKVIVLIDKFCFSACLDFIDFLKTLKIPILLVGQTTGADTLYMNIRKVKLPSGIGMFRFPTLVCHNRPRKNNVPYHPDIQYKGDIENTKEVKKWIKEIILK